MAQVRGEFDHVGLRFPPTPVYVAAMVGAAVCELLWPTAAAATTPLRVFIGLSLIAGSFVVVAAALRSFWRHDVDPNPQTPVPRLIDDGVYRVTRNPIYVGWLGILLGLAVCFDSLWMLMLVPFMAAFLDRAVIAPEEEYLEARLPDTYRAYCQRVRRWI